MSESKQNPDQVSPPVYSSSAESPPTSNNARYTSFNLPKQLTAIDLTQYRITGSTLRDDHVAVLVRNERFSRDPHVLLQLMHEQAQLPPRLLVRIRGSHSVYGEAKSDFDSTLNLLPLLVSESERWSYLKTDGSRIFINGEPEVIETGAVSSDLEKLVMQYCADPAPIKSFSLKRRVVNLDEDVLEGLIRTTIAKTRYRGTINIEFPLTFAEVIVQQGEVKTSFKDIFYWSLQPPAKKDPTKRYDCVDVIWPFANVPPNEPDRRCAVQSEQDWWASWKGVVRNAVLAKWHGHVTLEDCMNVAMGIEAPEPVKDWGATK